MMLSAALPPFVVDVVRLCASLVIFTIIFIRLDRAFHHCPGKLVRCSPPATPLSSEA